MSTTGLAHRPGTEVLPTCSSVSCSTEAAARMRAASARKRNGQRSSYSTSRTVPDSRPSESCDMLMKKECNNVAGDQSFAGRFRDGLFDAYEANGGFHVQTARPQLRDLARRVRRRSAPEPREPTRRGW